MMQEESCMQPAFLLACGQLDEQQHNHQNTKPDLQHNDCQQPNHMPYPYHPQQQNDQMNHQGPPVMIQQGFEFSPGAKKDPRYLEKRRRNNEAARRSRERRRFNDLVMESQALALVRENTRLRHEILTLRAQCRVDSSKPIGLLNVVVPRTSTNTDWNMSWKHKLHFSKSDPKSSRLDTLETPETQDHLSHNVEPAEFLKVTEEICKGRVIEVSREARETEVAPRKDTMEEDKSRRATAVNAVGGSALPHKLRIKTQIHRSESRADTSWLPMN